MPFLASELLPHLLFVAYVPQAYLDLSISLHLCTCGPKRAALTVLTAVMTVLNFESALGHFLTLISKFEYSSCRTCPSIFCIIVVPVIDLADVVLPLLRFFLMISAV